MQALEGEYNALKQENENLEKQLKAKLKQEQVASDESYVRELEQQKEAAAAREEAQNIKKQMQIVDQYVRKLESDLADEGSQNERTQKDLEIYKKKY